MTTTTTHVVTKQVTASGGPVATGNRDWNTGVLDCCTDCKTMICALCCLPCFAARQSQRMDESCLVPVCIPGGVIAMRTKLRMMLGIKGGICTDYIVMGCCLPCGLCQMAREMDQAGW